ncbi:hypothetical protein V5O48_005019 [Marasmius crinis-equi]|uniref:FAD dependent oxidoreductase domain-containing protein n=1 Tax=Marasmius crinis-equi TaxID=585013 RepID=A0ABR3FP85_9AGAR
MSTPLSVPLNLYASSVKVLDALPPRPPSLPVQDPTKSFWLDPEDNPLAKEGSTGFLGRDDIDICIIGSGITGISALWHIVKDAKARKSEKSLKIMILEARDFSSGATGRNGGHLLPNPFIGFISRQLAHGGAEAIKSFEFENKCTQDILEFIKQERIASEVDLVQGGHVMLLFSGEEEASTKADYDAAVKAGMKLEDIEWIERPVVERRYGAPYQAVKSSAYNLWPAKLVTALYNASKKIASESGAVEIFLHTSAPVTSTLSGPDGKTVVNTPRGTVKTKYVLHATNAYAAYLLPDLYGPGGIIPTRGQVIATRHAVGNGTEKDGEMRKLSWDGNDGFEYWFPRPRGSTSKYSNETPLFILGGGREIPAGFETHVSDDSTCNKEVGEGLRKFLDSVFVGSGKGSVEREWTGIMGFTVTGDPFVGPVLSKTPVTHKGHYVAAGYTGHGMPRAFSCGEIISSMILADLDGKPWEKPDWFPESYLTWNKK